MQYLRHAIRALCTTSQLQYTATIITHFYYTGRTQACRCDTTSGYKNAFTLRSSRISILGPQKSPRPLIPLRTWPTPPTTNTCPIKPVHLRLWPPPIPKRYIQHILGPGRILNRPRWISTPDDWKSLNSSVVKHCSSSLRSVSSLLVGASRQERQVDWKDPPIKWLCTSPKR